MVSLLNEHETSYSNSINLNTRNGWIRKDIEIMFKFLNIIIYRKIFPLYHLNDWVAEGIAAALLLY